MRSEVELSIIIAINPHDNDLHAVYAGLANQTLAQSRYEVIVVDPAHRNDSERALRRVQESRDGGPAFRYFRIAPGGRAKANNYGIQAAAGYVTVILADDFVATPQLAEAHLKFHEEHQEDFVVGIGPGRFPEALRNCCFRRWLEDSGNLFGVVFSEELAGIPEYYFYAGNVSAKKSFLVSAGLFDEDFPYDAWDDFEIGLRLDKNGMRAFYVPDAKAMHHHPVSLGERCEVLRRAGESAVIFERKHPGSHSWHDRCAIPPWRHGADAFAALVKFLATNNMQYRHLYYHHVLAAAFVDGYRTAKAQGV